MGLGRNPQDLPSVLINKPIPAFELAPIKGQTKGLSNLDLLGQVTLVNIFGSYSFHSNCKKSYILLIFLLTF